MCTCTYENGQMQNVQTPDIDIYRFLCLLRLGVLRVLCCFMCCLCTGHLLMAPFNLTCLLCLQHFSSLQCILKLVMSFDVCFHITRQLVILNVHNEFLLYGICLPLQCLQFNII